MGLIAARGSDIRMNLYAYTYEYTVSCGKRGACFLGWRTDHGTELYGIGAAHSYCIRMDSLKLFLDLGGGFSSGIT